MIECCKVWFEVLGLDEPAPADQIAQLMPHWFRLEVDSLTPLGEIKQRAKEGAVAVCSKQRLRFGRLTRIDLMLSVEDQPKEAVP